ncbi:Uncharacterised protein [Streptococcus pneumoniae]|nr:Uncharacterised protein [Streptococcus pneumoniae]
MITPGQFGPSKRVCLPAIYLFTFTISNTGIPSVIHTTKSISASTASIIASAAKAGGTYTTEAFAPVAFTASSTVSNTGTPSISVPPLPGVTPPTIFVPYSIICFVWNKP